MLNFTTITLVTTEKKHAFIGWETSLTGTDSIGHPTSGPDPAPQLCPGGIFSLNPNIFLAKPPRNRAFLPQTTRTGSTAGGAMLSQRLWTKDRGEFEAE